jgi:hypothetical protein
MALTILLGEPEADAWDPNTASFVVAWDDTAGCQDCEDVARDEHTEEREHIAGLGCMLEDQGYSGWHIGADEMRVRHLTPVSHMFTQHVRERTCAAFHWPSCYTFQFTHYSGGISRLEVLLQLRWHLSGRWLPLIACTRWQ